MTSSFAQPGLTIALALALGMVAQSVAHHVRVPGIVLLLATGVVCGPDGAGLIHPRTLGPALGILTGFAVAVILFEGGINLKFRRLRRAQRSIRQLILLGGLVTVAGAAAAVHFVMHWPWQNAVLFGTLVMVTGPTVINPLLKRLKVKRSVATVLEAEGVLIDAVGAVVATVALETALSPSPGMPLVWGWYVVSRLLFGALAGGAAGVLLVFLLRARRLIPQGTENVFTLAVVLALFQGSNTLLPESGIAAVTAAGIVVGNLGGHSLRDLAEFKEELTVLLIGMLFVLLAADVRLTQVAGLGWPAVGVVLILMVVVRPAAVWVGTGFTGMQWREKAFIGWIGPRGIVAAAVASFFAEAFAQKGLPGGYELRALVFLVIALTVVCAGLTGGVVAGALGLRRPSQSGWIVLGANALARAVAKLFKQDGQEVVCIDSNADHCTGAENDCTRVIFGNGLQSRYLLRAEIDTRRGALALTANDEVNFLFIQKAKEEFRTLSLWAALKSDAKTLTPTMLHKSGAELVFGATVNVDAWERRLNAKEVHLQRWRCLSDSPKEIANGPGFLLADYSGSGVIVVAVRRNGRLSPAGDLTRFKKADEFFIFVCAPEIDAVRQFLTQKECAYIDSVDSRAFTTSACQLETNGG